jgi:hypothetical protein
MSLHTAIARAILVLDSPVPELLRAVTGVKSDRSSSMRC